MKYRLTGFIACMNVAMLATATHAAGKPDVKPQPKLGFTVVQGKGWSACESYARFLNAQPASEPLPLCHLKLGPGMKEPDWEEIDIQSNLILVHAIENPTYPEYFKRLPFEEWNIAFQQRLKEGSSPRLRRTHLALVEGGAVETILAYEVDRNECDKTVEKKGYSSWGDGARLWLWDERKNKINEYHSGMTFPTAPVRLLLFHDKPLLFLTWGGNMSITPQSRFEGRIGVFHVFPAMGSSDPYGNKERCQIGFDLSPTIVERMTK